jgi:hypothetical protein
VTPVTRHVLPGNSRPPEPARDDRRPATAPATQFFNGLLRVYAHLFRKDDSKASDAIDAALAALGQA